MLGSCLGLCWEVVYLLWQRCSKQNALKQQQQAKLINTDFFLGGAAPIRLCSLIELLKGRYKAFDDPLKGPVQPYIGLLNGGRVESTVVQLGAQIRIQQAEVTAGTMIRSCGWNQEGLYSKLCLPPLLRPFIWIHRIDTYFVVALFSAVKHILLNTRFVPSPLGYEGVRKLRDAYRMQQHLSWYLSDFMLPSYGQARLLGILPLMVLLHLQK